MARTLVQGTAIEERHILMWQWMGFEAARARLPAGYDPFTGLMPPPVAEVALSHWRHGYQLLED